MTNFIRLKESDRFIFELFAHLIFDTTPFAIHVVSSDGEAKYWLEPNFELAKNHRYRPYQLKEIETLIEDHYHELVSAWRYHFER